jgi:predicted nucleic acid-binding protein
LARAAASARAAAVVGYVEQLAVTRNLLDTAGRLELPGLRSLDAIHIASALLLTHQLEAFVTYDVRQADAARALGLQVRSPGTDLTAELED